MAINEVERTQQAMKQLMDDDEKPNNHTTSSSEAKSEEVTKSPEIDESVKNDTNNDEIIKELRNVKRQNSITHCLLSAMIVLTIAWQFSEFSMVLKIKNGLSNPLKSVGGLIGGLANGGGRGGEINVQEAMNQVSKNHERVSENTSVPGLKIHELPHLLGFDSDEEE